MSDMQTAFRLVENSKNVDKFRVRIADDSPPIDRPDVEILTKGFVSGYTVESWWRDRWQSSVHMPYEVDRKRPYRPLNHVPESITIEDSHVKLIDTSPEARGFDAETATIMFSPHQEGYKVALRVESATGSFREATRILPLYSPNHPQQSEHYYRLSKEYPRTFTTKKR